MMEPTQPNNNVVQPGAASAPVAQRAAMDGPLPQAIAANEGSAIQSGRKMPAKSKTKSKADANSTQNSLLIAEIRDGLAIMSDGTFRAVVLCKSINFDLMSPKERESVEFAFQGFLNSLYFPVQIYIRSQKVDLRPYLQKLNKISSEQENMLLAMLMQDYISFLSDIAAQTNIMSKQFYLVISYPDPNQDVRSTFKQSTGFFTGLGDLFTPGKTPQITIDEATLENAKTELRNRVQAAMQGLLECGIQSLPLDTEELIELYYGVYNPDTANRQQINKFSDLTEPVVTKGDGEAPRPALGEGQV